MIGMVVAGLGIHAASLVGTAGEEETLGQVLAIAFGLNTTALVMLKSAIAIILVGILVRIWLRVESVKAALPALKADGEVGTVKTGDVDTEFGPATVSAKVPARMQIHKMANTMWGPMLLMGVMSVFAGLVVSLVWAANVGTDAGLDARAWTQGLQFLGEGLVLSSTSFLLASILSGFREGGGEVQEALGLPVMTLKMPSTAKAFIVLMAMSMMILIAAVIAHVVVGVQINAENLSLVDAEQWDLWLEAARRFAVQLYLFTIALGLGTIIYVIRFQSIRIREVAKVN